MSRIIPSPKLTVVKTSLVVSILVLQIMASQACDGTAPTSTIPGTLSPTASPVDAQTPTMTPRLSFVPVPPQLTFAPTPTRAPEPESTAGLREKAESTAIGERIDWAPCGQLECGSIQVFADYRNPAAGSINISVNVHRATSPRGRIGYLFVNPGGPGASGVEFAFYAVSGRVDDEVLERFDIVGFDPRGVGLSNELVAGFEGAGIDTGVLGGGSGPEFACGGLGEQISLLDSVEGDFNTPEEITAGEAAANLCIESMGPVGGLLGSEYVARDMDEIRQALGAEQISYYGVSYGSTLGVWYATLFPDSVRAMVLDGAHNPVTFATTQQERVDERIGRERAFEEILEEALKACNDPDCPIYNNGDPIGYFHQAVAKLGLVNAALGTPEAGAFGVLSNLYNEQDWPLLWRGLYNLQENNDPSILGEIAELQLLGQEPSATRFFNHVNCLDAWSLHPDLDRATRLADQALMASVLSRTLPLMAAIRSNSHLPSPCPFYDQFVPQPFRKPLDGGGVPILVVGNLDDPATSYRESEEFATKTLRNGYLLETSHFKHGVYPQNQCVNYHVHRVLIDGVYPDVRHVSCDREDWTANP